ncbi:copper chaperone CopZ [Deferribacter autotrophicus]|uniref:Copper chaperone CopZ n=1 Tax=Deferribacter autotrophicus TaxID=500465 RepID=A0A5A8F2T1_9BACT|nr:copper chaperone CopZ [Deferribacter autotrophicus]KAA0257799.1 copper chaperone CopZ [Deferribacter autotrophicus]
MAKIVIGVEGMSCHHCKMAVEKELKSLDGVLNAIVSLEAKNVEVEYDDEKVTIEQLKEAIEEAGYEPK